MYLNQRGIGVGLGRPPGEQRGSAGGGHQRNTLTNMQSKNPGMALPALSADQTANYYSQLSGLSAQYRTQQASLRAQRVGYRADFKTARAGIVRQRQLGMGAAESAALDRGIAGSSIDATNRANVVTDAASQISAAKSDMLNQIAQSRLQQQSNAIGFFQAQTGLQSQMLAQRESALAQQLQQNLIVSGRESRTNDLRKFYQSQLGGSL